MKQIEFKKTSNIFINTGIIALHRYLKRFQLTDESFGEIKNELLPDKLIVENEQLMKLLKEVYYFMGKEIYDTPSKKQKEQSDKFFFIEEPFGFSKFPKMNSFGLAGFITKPPFGPQPTPRTEPIKFSKLYKDKPIFAKQIAGVFKENNQKLKFFDFTGDGIVENKKQVKGDSAIYLNEPYSKTPRISLEKKYFDKGESNCPILNESFKVLISSKGAFAFTSNLENFNSFLESDDNRKVSLKAKYLALFAPALSMYSYYKGYDFFNSTFFNSNNLVNINSLYTDEFFYTKDEMEGLKVPFQRNIKLEDFKYAKKNNEDYTIKSGEDSYSPQEITFLLIYTFYRKKFKIDIEESRLKVEIDPFENSPFEKIPISLVTFKADKFASTMRPNFYEEYSNVKFIIRLIHLLETNPLKRIPISELWRGLIFKSSKSDSIKDYSKKMMLERKYRADIIAKLLKGKSILPDMENLYSKSYLILIKSKDNDPGRRRYDLLTELLTIYEPTINFGGINMDKSLQQRAINLGKSIGQGIINFDSPKNENEKKANAKNGRKYLISMHKARNIAQFREVLIRIQRKYSIAIANEIIENLSESNYVAIKQYAQISALNTLNVVLSNQKSDSQ